MNFNRISKMRGILTTLLTTLTMNIFLPKNNTVAVICGLTPVVCSMIMQNRRNRCKEKVKKDEIKPEIVCKVKDVPEVKKEISLKRECNPLVIPQLPAPRWFKVGKVTNLLAYPLVSGMAYAVDECEVRFDEMYMFEKGKRMKWDESFVVVDDRTKRVITCQTMPKLSNVGLTMKEHWLTLQAPQTTTLYTELRTPSLITCEYWCCNRLLTNNKLFCLDCGDITAQWLSRYLTGKDESVRLGYITNSAHTMSTFWYIWARNCILYRSTQNRYSMSPFVNILNSILISPTPYKNMTEELRIFRTNIKFCPNIVITVPDVSMRKIWEWIKIGEVIIKNVLPLQTWPRDNQHEMPKNAKFFAMGINCELHLSGRIKLGDNVYVHFPPRRNEVQ